MASLKTNGSVNKTERWVVILFWLTQKFNDVSMLLFMFRGFPCIKLSPSIYTAVSALAELLFCILGYFEYGFKTITLEPALSEMLLVHWFQFFYELES